MKQKITAKWEVIALAEWLENNQLKKLSDAELIHWFKGSFMPLYIEKRVSGYQRWNIKITTHLKNDNGEKCTSEIEWSFDKQMSMHEVLNGGKHIKVTHNGFKTRFKGVTKQWLSIMDDELGDEWEAFEAHVEASCVADVKNKPAMAILNMNKLIKGVV